MAVVITRRRVWMALDNQVREYSALAKSNGNGKRAFMVDTLGLVRRLEGQGVPSKQAEAITLAITEVLNDSLENVSQSFVSNVRMQMSEMLQDAKHSTFKSEVQSSQLQCEMLQDAKLSKFKSEVQSLQENHYSLLQRETEKIKTDIEKMRSELRYEVDKVTSGQRLDLNLERGTVGWVIGGFNGWDLIGCFGLCLKGEIRVFWKQATNEGLRAGRDRRSSASPEEFSRLPLLRSAERKLSICCSYIQIWLLLISSSSILSVHRNSVNAYDFRFLRMLWWKHVLLIALCKSDVLWWKH